MRRKGTWAYGRAVRLAGTDDRTVRTHTTPPGSLVSLFRDLEQACSIILSAFSRSCAKQKEREDRINSLQPEYHTSRDREIVNHGP